MLDICPLDSCQVQLLCSPHSTNVCASASLDRSAAASFQRSDNFICVGLITELLPTQWLERCIRFQSAVVTSHKKVVLLGLFIY